MWRALAQPIAMLFGIETPAIRKNVVALPDSSFEDLPVGYVSVEGF